MNSSIFKRMRLCFDRRRSREKDASVNLVMQGGGGEIRIWEEAKSIRKGEGRKERGRIKKRRCHYRFPVFIKVWRSTEVG